MKEIFDYSKGTLKSVLYTLSLLVQEFIPLRKLLFFQDCILKSPKCALNHEDETGKL